MRSRLAPTPSGLLHMGNVFSFVLTWLWVRANNGRLVLRIDDADSPRMRPAYLEDIFSTLDFLGLNYDEGPVSPDDFVQHYSQQHRFSYYEKLLHVLLDTGRLYHCSCSRAQLAAVPPLKHICRNNHASGIMPGMALRINMQPDDTATYLSFPAETVTGRPFEAIPDFIVWRKDGLPAYQLASVADDTLFNISHIVRGRDLEASTLAQACLAAQANISSFKNICFFHHKLLLKENGAKLSKSAGDTAIATMRKQGATAADIIQKIAAHVIPGAQNIQNLIDLQQAFQFEKQYVLLA